ncbi:MAG: hypothetical protein O7I42_13600, partial [Alphaproteobacteria bacterium]|nr:hypothetical protein [Alphaproteobacteria bacterium]
RTTMTVLERVRELLIKNSPMAICDDCIKEMLGLSIREHANHKTRQLASMTRALSMLDVSQNQKLGGDSEPFTGRKKGRP